MKHLATSSHFKKQLRKLAAQDQEKVIETLKSFLTFLHQGQIPAGFGFKKINGDKYEFRVSIRIRIVMKSEKDTLVCHVIGDHESVRRYLREYRNK